MKELKINYQEYVLPRETNNFQRVGKFVCEYFGFKTYRVDKTFSIKVENPDLFLANNKSFTVDPVILIVVFCFKVLVGSRRFCAENRKRQGKSSQ